MPRNLLVTVLLALVQGFSLWAADSGVYSGDGIRVDLSGSFAIRATPGSTVYGDALPQPEKTIDFCQWHPQPPDVQQVMRPESGYLCELHVMPAKGENEMLAQLERLAKQKRPDHGQTFRIKSEVIHGHRVVRWRFQAGKTRLDHFMLFGKRHNYLFVSSPYGSNGQIEKILGYLVFQ